jgi:chromosome partitioning protein
MTEHTLKSPSLAFRASLAAAALGISIETLRRSAQDAEINLERKQTGATSARMFKPEDLFQIARWRSERIGPKPTRKVVAAIWNPKGGIGKTTIAANLAVTFGLQGMKVLVVDLDFQGSLSNAFNYDSDLTPEEATEIGKPREMVVEYTLANLLPGTSNRRTLDEVLKKPYGEYGPHLIPADIQLDHLDYLLLASTLQGTLSDLVIGNWIKEGRSGNIPGCDLSSYDLILFDCPPSKNRLTRAAMLAATHAISPVRFEYFSTKALSYLAEVIDDMENNYNRRPEMTIVGNEFDSGRIRAGLHLSTLARVYGDVLLNQTIRRSEDFPKSLDDEPRTPLALLKPSSDAAQDLRIITKELIDRMNFFAEEK